MSRTYSRKKLIEHCLNEIELQVSEVNALFSSEEEEILLTSPYPGKWSPKQCLEHLSLTLELYLPRIESKLNNAKKASEDNYSHGLIGYKFFSDVLPKKDQSLERKMKTFKKLNPGVTGKKTELVVRGFAEKMMILSSLLESSKTRNLQREKITSAAGFLLKLKLGDVYPFILNHNSRHILQAKKAIQINLKRKGFS